ncbi:type II toxin-antitoxin system VapC family toxin [Aquisalimonas sp. 2447]|uniref:type II toxin-antitoxin system VapC family toxin n=1 Tax=Aquisalimonas sp. 2447 TaxID=2740807 RepID=UPI0014325360|nr:type II toxin-antitoxin system VapC family toxin [Aquisalimonas sp. 2447]QIT55241.1 type II toxin-antitoxin system VapC family toxin [Aquisalimonas sp. 2447]
MILLDTNVLSEMMRPEPAPAVIEWLNETDSGSLYLCSITIGEIEYGLHAMPDGRRRDDLSERFDTFVSQAFALRVLSYDDAAALHYGRIMAARRSEGRPLSAPDGQIAAIARLHGMRVATRNASDFTGTGVELINPWDTGGSA